MLDILNSTSHVVQLLIALSLAIVLFVAAFSGYGRALFLGLLVMIPFQPIDSKYGSLNMVLTWLVGFSVWLDSLRHRSAGNGIPPMIWQFGLLAMVFFLSVALAPSAFLKKYLIHSIVIGSNVVLFYLSYWYVRNERDLETFFRALIISNVLVALYTGLQMIIGFGTFSLGGIQELSLIQNRADQRLSGPFQAVGITAEYLVIQSLILVHYMVQTGRLRRLGIVLLTVNFALMVGTGNRGGFLVAIGALFLFLYHYRRYIGQRGVVLAFVGFFVFGGLASFVMVKFTDFDVLFSRLAGTELEGGVIPEDRLGWATVVDYIKGRPVLGHGPRIVLPEEYAAPTLNWWPRNSITFYPHNLYLYILYTTGFVGLAAYAVWALSYWRSLSALRRRWDDSRYRLAKGLPTLGLIIFVVFLVDQYKVEFLRYYFLDYQQFLASLFAMFLALRKVDANTRRAAAVAARSSVAG
jgi:O-antigen ligase